MEHKDTKTQRYMTQMFLRSKFFVSLCLCVQFVFSLTSCYRQPSPTPDAWSLTEQQLDSISFYTTHHYTENYNFVVTSDSLLLVSQHPTEVVNGFIVDTISVIKNDRIVVADIITMPNDTVDSIWVRVARDEATIGWTHERDLLDSVSPDTPISRFIDFFSDTHKLITLAILGLILALFVVRKLMKLGAKMVFFNDIDSFYPTCLCVLVAFAAVWYSSIQLFAPESWRHYYYHPTLNPFALPFHLSGFLSTVWLMVLVGIASVDEVKRCLPLGDAIFYVLGLLGICAITYIVFSVSTLYFLGYPLLFVYTFYSVRQFVRRNRKL